MAKAETNTQFHNDEFSRIFDEYRAKIEEITQRTERHLQQVGEVADSYMNNDGQKPDVIIFEVQPESGDNSARAGTQYGKETARIINEAKREAQQIIDEAEERAKKEAKQKTKSQVEKIINKAQKESEDIIAQARQTAEKERNEIIATSKREVEQLIKEITEKCRVETQAQSSQVVAEAREKAAKMIADVMTSSQETSQLVTEIVNRAKNTIHEFETKLQAETGEITEAISEIQKKLAQFNIIAKEKEEPKEPGPNKIRETIKNPALSVRLLGEKTNGGNSSNPLFSGKVELKSISSSFDYQYIKNLKKYLIRIPSIKYLEEYASEKETCVLFEIQEPLPLLDILNNVPLVDEVITEDDDICVVFKNNPLRT